MPTHVRAWFARARNRYPELPPAPTGRRAVIGTATVVTLMLAFSWVFVAYTFAKQNAFLTHAEDMGIMDQAIWNTTHGALLHQTVCNIVSDHNCLGDISRLAIHFEPLMFPISLVYAIFPSVKTLLLIQTVVVAMGALPAYWIASRRLHSITAGVAFALIYLALPVLQAGVVYDFHVVTLASTFLMFALYFMLTRNDTGLLISCVLALSTKEQMVLSVAMIGLSILLLQRRWRTGSVVVALAAVWLAVELAIMHAASPLGHSPTASRFAWMGGSPPAVAIYLLSHPLQVIRTHVLQAQHRFYLQTLLSPLAYLPLLSPLTLLIAVPDMGINLLSSDTAMYSGMYQYNAQIVPVLILATIESVALLAAVARHLAPRCARAVLRLGTPKGDASRLRRTWEQRLRTPLVARLRVLPAKRRALAIGQGAAIGLTLMTLGTTLRAQHLHGYSPLAEGFAMPSVTTHDQVIDNIIRLIPPGASVSAQSDLVPHVSQRHLIYMYPYQAATTDYVLLDVTGNLYPLQTDPSAYTSSVQALLTDGRHHLVAARDGVILLELGPGPRLPGAANAYDLPPSFYTFATASSSAIPHRVDVRFGASLQLVGYSVTPSPTLNLNNAFLHVTTYWRVTAPLTQRGVPDAVFLTAAGRRVTTVQAPTLAWLPTSRWRPGTTYAVAFTAEYFTSGDLGTLRVGVRVLTGTGKNAGALPAQLAPVAPSSSGNTDAATPTPVLTNGGSVALFAQEQINS